MSDNFLSECKICLHSFSLTIVIITDQAVQVTLSPIFKNRSIQSQVRYPPRGCGEPTARRLSHRLALGLMHSSGSSNDC